MSIAAGSGQIPLVLKLIVTLWVAVLIPHYWRTTPLTFLWFCDAALLLSTLGLWLESRLLVSMAAVGSSWWMLLWVVDVLVHLIVGVRTMPLPLGMANYMFEPEFSHFTRIISLYHGWLPFVLLWGVRRLGYDRRAVWAQTGFAWLLLLLSYGLTSDPHGPAGNLNMVYGLSPTEAQSWMSPGLWLLLVMCSVRSAGICQPTWSCGGCSACRRPSGLDAARALTRSCRYGGGQGASATTGYLSGSSLRLLVWVTSRQGQDERHFQDCPRRPPDHEPVDGYGPIASASRRERLPDRGVRV